MLAGRSYEAKGYSGKERTTLISYWNWHIDLDKLYAYLSLVPELQTDWLRQTIEGFKQEIGIDTDSPRYLDEDWQWARHLAMSP